jgi:hypothetical protein
VGELRVQLAESGTDAEHLDQLTGYLRQELLALDVGEVRSLPAGPPPPGTRAIDALAIGGLLVTLTEGTQNVHRVVAAIKSWLSRGSGVKRTVRLELDGDVLELSEASANEQTRLIELFVDRHTSATEE